MLSKNTFILFASVTLLAFFSFWYVFKMGIYCDDILSAHNFVAYGTPIRSIFSPYGGQNLSMRFFYSLFSLNSQPYFIVLFIIRLVSGLFVYLLAKQFSQSKTVGLFTFALYLVGYAGVGTSDYAILANIPISISFLLLGFVLFASYIKKSGKSSSLKSLSFFTIICSLFIVSIIIATVRVNALVYYYPLIEFILLCKQKSSFRSSLYRLIIFGSFVLLLKHLGSFGGDSAYHISMIKNGLSSEFSSLEVFGKSIYYNIAIVGDIISPPALDSIVLGIFNYIRLNAFIYSGIFIPTLATIAFYLYRLILKNIKTPVIFLTLPLLYTIYLVGFYFLFRSLYTAPYYDREFSNFSYQAINTILGGFFIYIISLVILRLYRLNNHKPAFILLLSLLWEPAFMTITYLFSPRTFEFETFASYPIWMQESYVHYYFVPALGIYFLLAYLSTTIRKYKYLYFMLIVMLIVANAISVRQFFYNRLPFRSDKVLSSAINNINKEISLSYKHNKTPIIYFTSIDDNTWYFPYVISQWGFGQYEYSLINNNPGISPLLITDRNDLDSILTKLSSLNDLYAFKVDNGRVISQTKQFRYQLSQSQK